MAAKLVIEKGLEVLERLLEADDYPVQLIAAKKIKRITLQIETTKTNDQFVRFVPSWSTE